MPRIPRALSFHENQDDLLAAAHNGSSEGLHRRCPEDDLEVFYRGGKSQRASGQHTAPEHDGQPVSGPD
jgi:hypothetical protein